MEQTDSAQVPRSQVLGIDLYMSNANDRLQSFKDRWPKHFFIKPLDLANAGFYYYGQGDKVQCFFCKLILKDWCQSDIAQEEHFKWSSDCAFLQMTFCGPRSHNINRGKEVYNCGCDTI